ncbi:hypothetical protein B0H10DRAFT_1953032 [Mycena sp. CBHHK59/15]|nr:hypothetical protein B0H10DRAFT_1953032 [Mycena sp. CBHHK59/15]
MSASALCRISRMWHFPHCALFRTFCRVWPFHSEPTTIHITYLWFLVSSVETNSVWVTWRELLCIRAVPPLTPLSRLASCSRFGATPTQVSLEQVLCLLRWLEQGRVAALSFSSGGGTVMSMTWGTVSTGCGGVGGHWCGGGELQRSDSGWHGKFLYLYFRDSLSVALNVFERSLPKL